MMTSSRTRHFVHRIRGILFAAAVPVLLFLTVSVQPALAQSSSSTSASADASPGYGFRNPLGTTDIPSIIGRIIYWLGGLSGSLFFLYLLWGGVQWMTAGGDGKKLAEAQGRIKAAAAGIIVILFAYTVVAAIIGAVPH